LREIDQIADRLAKHALGVDVNFHVYVFALDFVVLELRVGVFTFKKHNILLVITFFIG